MGRLVASFLVMAAVFGLACPYQVLNLSQVLADFGSETSHVASDGLFHRLVSFGWATHLVRMMPALVTWPMAVAAWAGMLLAVARRRDDDLLLLLWLALWAGVVGFDGRSYSRYYVPLLPALAFFAARGLGWAWGKWVPRPSSDLGVQGRTLKQELERGTPERIADRGLRRVLRGRLAGRSQSAVRMALAALVLAVVLVPAAGMSWAWARLYSRENARTLAGAWIAEHIPAGASIGMTKWPWQFEMPPLNPARYRLAVLADSPEHSPYDLLRLAQLRPDYFVASSLQYGRVDMEEQPGVLDLRGAPRAEFFWTMLLTADASMYRPAVPPFEVPLTLLGRRIEPRDYPEDMQYVNPRILVLEPNETQASAEGTSKI